MLPPLVMNQQAKVMRTASAMRGLEPQDPTEFDGIAFRDDTAREYNSNGSYKFSCLFMVTGLHTQPVNQALFVASHLANRRVWLRETEKDIHWRDGAEDRAFTKIIWEPDLWYFLEIASDGKTLACKLIGPGGTKVQELPHCGSYEDKVRCVFGDTTIATAKHPFFGLLADVCWFENRKLKYTWKP